MSAPRRVVYVLESCSDPDRHYTGICTDVSTRLAFHNEGLSEHTAKHRPWRLLVAIEFADQATAWILVLPFLTDTFDSTLIPDGALEKLNAARATAATI
jgi:putative endonuclease